jgi:transcriptional regulator with XRE-family HTH domain
LASCWRLIDGDAYIQYEGNEEKPSVGMAAKITVVFKVSLDFLVGNTDLELDKSLIDKVVSIQKLPDEDKSCIMYSLDGLIQHAKTRLAYK